jgi:hypothetical protein
MDLDNYETEEDDKQYSLVDLMNIGLSNFIEF